MDEEAFKSEIKAQGVTLEIGKIKFDDKELKVRWKSDTAGKQVWEQLLTEATLAKAGKPAEFVKAAAAEFAAWWTQWVAAGSPPLPKRKDKSDDDGKEGKEGKDGKSKGDRKKDR